MAALKYRRLYDYTAHARFTIKTVVVRVHKLYYTTIISFFFVYMCDYNATKTTTTTTLIQQILTHTNIYSPTYVYRVKLREIFKCLNSNNN